MIIYAKSVLNKYRFTRIYYARPPPVEKQGIFGGIFVGAFTNTFAKHATVTKPSVGGFSGATLARLRKPDKLTSFCCKQYNEALDQRCMSCGR